MFVQFLLQFVYFRVDHIFLFRRKELRQNADVSPLYESIRYCVKNVWSVFHLFDVIGRRIEILPIFNGIHKLVRKFLFASENIWLHKIHHAVVFMQIVLHGCAREYDSPWSANFIHGNVDQRFIVLQNVSITCGPGLIKVRLNTILLTFSIFRLPDTKFRNISYPRMRTPPFLSQRFNWRARSTSFLSL